MLETQVDEKVLCVAETVKDEITLSNSVTTVTSSKLFKDPAFCIGRVDEFEPNKTYKIQYDNHDWVLWKNDQNKISIIDNVCSHRFAPLSDGKVCKARNSVVCPYHNYEFSSDGD